MHSFNFFGFLPILLIILSNLFNFIYASNSLQLRASSPRKKLYDFQFSWTNSSDDEDRTGEAGYKVLGHMRDFGRIEGSSSFNYDGDPSYGQSFSGDYTIGTSNDQTNTPINGLGGGYTFNVTNLDIGAGISAFNQKVNFQLDIGKNGDIFINFDLIGSQAPLLNCQPINSTTTTTNDTAGMTCTVTSSK